MPIHCETSPSVASASLNAAPIALTSAFSLAAHSLATRSIFLPVAVAVAPMSRMSLRPIKSSA